MVLGGRAVATTADDGDIGRSGGARRWQRDGGRWRRRRRGRGGGMRGERRWREEEGERGGEG